MGIALLSFSLPSELFFPSLISQTQRYPFPELPTPPRVLLGFRPLCTVATPSSSTPITAVEPEQILQTQKHSILLDKLRSRHLKNSPKAPQTNPSSKSSLVQKQSEDGLENSKNRMFSSFEELGLNEEVMRAVEEMGISVPTEIQCIGIPAVLRGKNVVLGSHTGSGKTLAYMLPIVQLLKEDEALLGMQMKPRRPRAVVLCPTRELSEQVFHVAKAISHHARFRSTMVSGGGRLRPQEDSLNTPIDTVVGTPGRVLQHIEDRNMVYGDIKYLVLDEADTMFDRGFGPDIRKFLGPLKNRASKSDDQGYQTVLVTATITKAVQKLIDEEFQGIEHLRTLTLHKKIASARHDFIKLSGSENKLEALLQVLRPSLSKGNKVMVFCNTLSSSRAVDHFLGENSFYTINYHGEVPAEQRVENLQKFKIQDADCPTLVCTDLAARGLDLDVDHVIMFDFPLNSIDYLHRTGRTARMGAKGKVTSLVARKDLALATQIEEAMRKNESLESLTVDNVHRNIAKPQISEQKGKNKTLVKYSNQESKIKAASVETPNRISARRTSGPKLGKVYAPVTKSTKTVHTPISSSKGESSGGKIHTDSRGPSGVRSTSSKLSVVGFRGRSSLFKETVKLS